jgi:hypothetical protein
MTTTIDDRHHLEAWVRALTGAADTFDEVAAVLHAELGRKVIIVTRLSGLIDSLAVAVQCRLRAEPHTAFRDLPALYDAIASARAEVDAVRRTLRDDSDERLRAPDGGLAHVVVYAQLAGKVMLDAFDRIEAAAPAFWSSRPLRLVQ